MLQFFYVVFTSKDLKGEGGVCVYMYVRSYFHSFVTAFFPIAVKIRAI